MEPYYTSLAAKALLARKTDYTNLGQVSLRLISTWNSGITNAESGADPEGARDHFQTKIASAMSPIPSPSGQQPTLHVQIANLGERIDRIGKLPEIVTPKIIYWGWEEQFRCLGERYGTKNLKASPIASGTDIFGALWRIKSLFAFEMTKLQLGATHSLVRVAITRQSTSSSIGCLRFTEHNLGSVLFAHV